MTTGSTDWEGVRRQFPLTKDFIHLSQFYMVSHPRPVSEAIDRYRAAIDANPFLTVERGMFGTETEQRTLRVLEAAARYTGGRPEEIALVPNTTTGLALVYHGMPLVAGDEVVTTEHDHFTQHEAIRLSTQRVGASWRKIRLFEDPRRTDIEEMLRRLRASLRPETRVLGITWVHSDTGLVLPVRAFAEALSEVNRHRAHGRRVLLVVDGTHGFGARRERVAELGADFFVSSTHKWIFGPRGTGIVRAPVEAWAELQPSIATYYTWDLFRAWAEEREPGPTRAEYVTPGGFIAYEHQWAMVEAFEFHESIGRAAIAARVGELNGRLKRGLAAIGGVDVETPEDPDWSAGIVTFSVAGVSPEEVVSLLLDRRIIASVSPYPEPRPRLSAGIMNTEAEVDRAIEAVAEIAREGSQARCPSGELVGAH